MAEFRLVATDLDGTLLGPHGEISSRNSAALQVARARGIAVALATSRRWVGTVPATQALDLHGPLILYDGAIIQQYPTRRIIARDTLAAATAQQAMELLTAQGLFPIAQYADEEGEYLRAHEGAATAEWTRGYLERYAHQVTFAPLARLCRDGMEPLRVVAFGPLSAVRRAAPTLAALGCGRQVLLSGSYGHAELTLFSPTASKGHALATLARYLGIALDQTLAIGDGLNDVSMLRAAGLGIAMGHAPRRVRAIADTTTASNAEDGLALALERYLLSSAAGASTGSVSSCAPCARSMEAIP